MIITDRVSVNSKWYVNPRQGGKTFNIVSEVKFVEDLLNEDNNVKEILDRWQIDETALRLYNDFMIGMFFKYGYTMLRLNRNQTRQWAYENLMSVIDRWLVDYKEEKIAEAKKNNMYKTTGSSWEWWLEMVDSDVKHTRRAIEERINLKCFGEYENMINIHNGSERRVRKYDYISYVNYGTLNSYEFDIRMRPLQFEEPLYFYEDELRAICDICNDVHELVVAWQMIVKAKQYESSRKWYDDKGFRKLYDTRRWWTPLYRNKHAVKDLGIAPSKTHTKQGYNILLYSVYNSFVEAGLFEANKDRDYSWLKIERKPDGEILGASVIGKVRKNGTLKEYTTVISSKRLRRIKAGENSAYKPTFLTLQKDEAPVITLDYYEVTHGFVFELYEFLSAHKELRDKFLEGNKVQIKTCSECGHRFMVILDGEKGRAPKHCAECGTPKAKMKRSRAKKDKENL